LPLSNEVSLMPLSVFISQQPADISLPWTSMEQLCDRARAEWGSRSIQSGKGGRTVVLQWMRGFGLSARRRGDGPISGFQIRWGAPSAHQATIERIGWDVHQGATARDVQTVIDSLAGWPAATISRVYAEKAAS
jgi:hypothetical protein